jgi:metal transporter CNNM
MDIKEQYDSENGLLVKDLPLYPLPIIQEDMAVYDLLNMFQLGMSRQDIQ